MTDSHQPPAARVRIGLIEAAIWRNQTDHGPRYAVTLCRHYKDHAGDWQTTGSFSRDDLLPLAKAADQAHTSILGLQADDRDRSSIQAAARTAGSEGR